MNKSYSIFDVFGEAYLSSEKSFVSKVFVDWNISYSFYIKYACKEFWRNVSGHLYRSNGTKTRLDAAMIGEKKIKIENRV